MWLTDLVRATRAYEMEVFASSYFGGSASMSWRLIKLGVIIVAIGLLTDFAVRGVGVSDKKSKRLGFKRFGRDRAAIKQLVLSDKAVKQAPQRAKAQLNAKRKTLTEKVVNLWTKLEAHTWDQLDLRKDLVGDVRPILVFVNTRSGGCQGVEVIEEMRQLLHKVQVVDLKQETPDAALAWWGKTGVQFRVLVCGGDGTVGWVLGVLERLQLEYTPPVAILPLGTGNDLARVMGWGGGFTGGSIEPILRNVGSAHVALLDRWQVTCRDLPQKVPPKAPRFSIFGAPAKGPQKSGAKAGGLKRMVTTAFSGRAEERKSMVLCNYFGIGVDAAVALDFHTMRESSPHLFVSRTMNKIWYAKSGAMSTYDKIRFGGSIKEKINVYVNGDKEPLDLPDNLEGVIVLNIASFGGGTDLWGADKGLVQEEDDSESEGSENSDGSEKSPKNDGADSMAFRDRRSRMSHCLPESLTRPSMQDRKLEVVGVHGAAQLGAAQVGLYTADRLAQAVSVRIENKVEIAVEVDGEPWVFAKDGEVEITHKSQAFMLQTSKESNHAVATDVVDWALQKEIITTAQRDDMMTEIARRVQIHQSQSSSNLQQGLLGRAFGPATPRNQQ